MSDEWEQRYVKKHQSPLAKNSLCLGAAAAAAAAMCATNVRPSKAAPAPPQRPRLRRRRTEKLRACSLGKSRLEWRRSRASPSGRQQERLARLRAGRSAQMQHRQGATQLALARSSQGQQMLAFPHPRCAKGRARLSSPIKASTQPSPRPVMDNQMDLIKAASRVHQWCWNEADKSHECIVSQDKLEVCFHPECSESAAAIRASEPLNRNGNYYYWEIKVYDKTYGTSVMFGLCTLDQQLHANDYCNLIGLDRNGWSLSHKGSIWHAGKQAKYTQLFPPNQSITLGLLFNTMRGELSYFINGKNLGVAFCGLNNVKGELYPVIGSTAKCTRMRLLGTYCGYMSLVERSCFCLLKSARSKEELIETMHQNRIPKKLIEYMAETAEICDNEIL